MSKDSEPIPKGPKPVPGAPDGATPEPAAEASKPSGGPLGMLFPPDIRVWAEARKLVGDREIRIEDLAICSSQDPVIVIELLRTANAMFFSGGRSPISSVKAALVRLGSDVVQETFDKLRERSLLTDEASRWFEIHRSRSKRTAIVARVLGEALARQLSDDCQTAGLLMHAGELLAVAHFKETYAKLAEEHQRSGVNYRLQQDHKFDVERMGLSYLKRQGVPESILFAIDRDGRSRAADRAIMKPLCQAAAELVDAFDTNRWEKVAPGRTLHPKSALRLLQMNEGQYLKIYERCSEYLFSARLLEERQRDTVQPQSFDEIPITQTTAEETALDLEIRNLIQPGDTPPAASELTPAAPTPKVPQVAQAQPVAESTEPTRETDVKELSNIILERGEQFDLKNVAPGTKVVARAKRTPDRTPPPPKLHTKGGTKTVSAITSMFDAAATSEELLSTLLQMLVDDGPFEKSALIVVSQDRTKGIVVAARGPMIGNGQELSLDDPLSPLAHCFSKLQSFATKGSKDSPWGSKSFAVAPIDADHSTPVALYADCGMNGALTFEARRIFRTVVEVLNQRLPTIPGGIPVELS